MRTLIIDKIVFMCKIKPYFYVSRNLETHIRIEMNFGKLFGDIYALLHSEKYGIGYFYFSKY